MTTEPTVTAEPTIVNTNETADTNVSKGNNELSDFKNWVSKQEGSSKEQPKAETKQDLLRNEAKEDGNNKPTPKTWNLKVNGKEIEFDASNEDRIKAEVQKGLAAQEKFQQSAKIQKQAEQFINMLQTNPEAVLSHPSLGINLREFAENYLYKQLKAEQMSPEERQAKTEKEELERYRAERAEAKKQEEAQKMEQLKEQYRQDYANKFQQALEKTGIPKNDWSIKRMADYMREAIRRGHSNITPEDVAPMVREDWLGAQRELLSSLDGEKLIEMVGKDTAEKIRKYHIEQVNKANPFQQQKQSTTFSKDNKQKDKKKTNANLYDFIDNVK